ncbi:heterokaryon incompatibility protein-domain-containing protein [Apiospora sp. TS-2023a]
MIFVQKLRTGHEIPNSPLFMSQEINTKQTGLPNVDYSFSVAEVYTATAANYFKKAGYLDLLASCDLASDRIPELPSWVPDFSTSPKARAFFCNGLLATNTVPRVGFPNGPRGGVLRMPGVTKPSLKVKAVEVMGSSQTEATEAILSILDMVPAIDETYVGRNETFVDALCSALGFVIHRHSCIPNLPNRTLKEARGASLAYVS